MLISVLIPPQAIADTPPPTIEEILYDVSQETGVSYDYLYTLAECESSLDPLKKNGNDRGLFQINSKYHPEVEDVCAYNARCSAEWTAKRIKAGYSYEWTCANCYSFTKLYVDPPKGGYTPSGSPQEGSVAIFIYKGVPHYAIVKKLSEKGFWVREANFGAPKIQERFVEWGDKALRGFYSPDSS